MQHNTFTYSIQLIINVMIGYLVLLIMINLSSLKKRKEKEKSWSWSWSWSTWHVPTAEDAVGFRRPGKPMNDLPYPKKKAVKFMHSWETLNILNQVESVVHLHSSLFAKLLKSRRYIKLMQGFIDRIVNLD